MGASLEFEWDPTKAEANLKKHGVGFGEALTVFADSLARIFSDPDHSEQEQREIIVGFSTKSRLLVVGFTDRGGTIRIISARRATAMERRRHEENTKNR
ncbi:MAG: BrnT family toxin [Bryobacterales bacterium]|nr:BrnT family toxin [Bryobacterales bacterium]